MLRLVLCLVALAAFAAADLRPLNSRKSIKVQRQEDVTVTDMDRMSYDGLFTVEQTHPESLTEDIPIEDVLRILEASVGPDFRDYVDVDESQPITYLELIRLSTSVSRLNRELELEDARIARGSGDGDEDSGSGYKRSGKKTNFCHCHGTSKELSYAVRPSPQTGRVGNSKSHPFKGVRISGRGQGHIKGITGHNAAKGAPYAVPRDCALCTALTEKEGFPGEYPTNCNACCNGLCTAGDIDDYNTAFTDYIDWPFGLYPCPTGWEYDGSGVGTEGEDINDISACNFVVEDCPSAVALCKCTEKRALLKELECSCAQVLIFCDSCFDAWDAIDAYKHCDCEDYALHYQGDGPNTST